MPTNGNHKFKTIEKKLLSDRQELGERLRGRLGEVFIDREPDDEAAQATYNISRDMMAATIERERKTLSEIEAALKRISEGDYGVCESCEEPISEARLRALPWARLCISCASGATTSRTDYLRLRTAS
jgi:RNA polymerase-binding protein DksA